MNEREELEGAPPWGGALLNKEEEGRERESLRERKQNEKCSVLEKKNRGGEFAGNIERNGETCKGARERKEY